MGAVSKSLFASKTFWTCVVGAFAEILTAAGVHVLDDPGTQAEIVGMVIAGAATYFRHTATQPTHIIAPLLLVALLAGCATGPDALPASTQIASKAQAIQPTLVAACNTAMTLAPLAGPYAPFILGGCGTAEAIDKLAADPSSTAWVDGIIAGVQALRQKA